MIAEPCKFWMVWTKKGRKPSFIHGTQLLAEAEAQRLAKKYAGQKFIVLRAEQKFHVKPDARPSLETVEEADNG